MASLYLFIYFLYRFVGSPSELWEKNRTYLRMDGSLEGKERVKVLRKFNSDANYKTPHKFFFYKNVYHLFRFIKK